MRVLVRVRMGNSLRGRLRTMGHAAWAFACVTHEVHAALGTTTGRVGAHLGVHRAHVVALRCRVRRTHSPVGSHLRMYMTMAVARVGINGRT